MFLYNLYKYIYIYVHIYIYTYVCVYLNMYITVSDVDLWGTRLKFQDLGCGVERLGLGFRPWVIV